MISATDPTETPEQRARRLGLISETPEQRAERLGLVPPVSPHRSPALGMPRVASDMTAGPSGPRQGTRIQSVSDQGAGPPGIGSKVLGAIAAVDRDVPGAEAAQAGVRALVRGQSYRDARNDIRTAEDAAPAAARIPARLVGGTLAAMALPGGAVAQGARYGALEGLGQSDPDANVHDRLKSGVIGAAVGGAAGKAGDVLGVLARSKLPVAFGGVPSLGENALNRKAAMAAADATAFGNAAAEGDVAGSTPAVQQALAAKDIQPYVKAVRSTRAFADANDNTVLREAYKLMSERQAMLEGRLSNNDFKAGTSLENRDIGAAKRDMLHAASDPMLENRPPISLDVAPETYEVDPRVVSGHGPATGPVNGQALHEYTTAPNPTLRQGLRNFGTNHPNAVQGPAGPQFQLRAQSDVVQPGIEINTPAMRIQTAPAETVEHPAPMPSLRAAVQQHAEMAGDRDAFRLGADAGKRIIKGAQPAAKNLEQKSPEAVLNVIRQMPPSRAQAASEGVIGALKNNSGLKANPFTGFGIFPALRNANRVGPYVSAADDVSGNNTGAILRAIGITGLTPSP